MLKKILKWIWDDAIDIGFMLMGCYTIYSSLQAKDTYYLILGLWLISMPALERKLKTLIEMGNLMVMSLLAQAMKIREELLEKEAKQKANEAAG